jgi:aminoglycoside 2''-phosphotransferase
MSPELLARIAALIGSSSTDAGIVEAGQNSRVLDFGDRIVRIPRNADAEAALRREARVLSRLRPLLPVAVPDVRILDSEIGSVAVHERLPCEPFYSVDGFGDGEQVVRQLAAFLLCLHKLNTALVPDGQRDDSWREVAERLPTDILPRLSPSIRSEVAARFRRFESQADTLPVGVIHGDFGTGNILAAHDRLTGVIDFAGCGLGDPAYDIASLVAGLGDELLMRLARHYPGLATMTERIVFYRSTFPLQDMLFGIDHDDPATLAEGMAGAERAFAGPDRASLRT